MRHALGHARLPPAWALVMVLACAPACDKALFDRATASDAGAGRDAARDGVVDAPTDLTAPLVCTDDTPSRSKNKGEPCGCDRQCQTGFCVDGVCCTSSCGETCMACNLASSLGECAPVPAGAQPGDPSLCLATTAGTCGLDGTCDGKGGCRKYPRGTECKPGTCQGDSVEGIQTCDGEGNCSQTTSQLCPPYTCDPKKNGCARKCTTDSDCSSGRLCVAGSCGKSANGAECDNDDGCLSGFCVDGVCCNIACTGACVTCNETGSRGRCTFLPVNRADPECNGQDATTCGRTGACDGAGRCTIYRENTVCGSSECSGLFERTAKTCDGRGNCREPQLVECAPFLCSNGTCETSCDPNGTDVCEPGHACVSKTVGGVTQGICGKRKNGQVCATADDCDSGQCVDGVCCESSCEGPCRSCNVPGSPGRCLNAAAGASDPRKTCKDLGAKECSTNGLCDGQGACASYPVGTACGEEKCDSDCGGDASCVPGTYHPPATCNAAGQCVESRTRTCAPFRCNGNACFGSCTSDSQCTDGNFCRNDSCGLKPPGSPCSDRSECQSGFCAQGVCCDSACTGSCVACNLANSAGLCKAVPDGAPDPQGKCAVTDPATCGTTGACRNGVCAFAEGNSCKPSVCVGATPPAPSSSVTPTSTCDGRGVCQTPQNQSCGGFVCENGACKISCTPATEKVDCVAPATCANGTCGLKVNGATCSSANQCLSGFCTEGVCCNNACADAASGGLCKTCKGTSSAPPGICSNVAAGTADPKGRCVASSPTDGDCSNAGVCDGGGKCQAWSATTGCRKESCTNTSTGSSHTLAATCDGRGACPAASVVSCGSYVCSSTSPTCLNNCTSDEDCVNDLTCLKTNNRCGGKLPAGEVCVADTDCETGLVCSAEKVCCNAVCGGSCQSCKVAGSVGSCTIKASCSVDNSICPTDTTKQISAIGTCSSSTTCEPVLEPCGGFLCISGGKCATSCTAANESTNCNTAEGYRCVDGTCQKKAVGEACAGNGECSNNQCVHGYCCDAASCGDGVCQSCGFEGSPGRCTTVAAGQPSGTCTPTCVDGTAENRSCDGTGQCKLNSSTVCSKGTHCSAGVCSNACSPTLPCPTGYKCAADSTCKVDIGGACDPTTECESGFCVDNFCCDEACSGDCRTCKATPGTCTNAPTGLPNRGCQSTCTPSGDVSNGTCNSSGNCDLVIVACTNGTRCSETTKTCSSACTSSPDSCPPGYTCASDNTCKLSLGQPCNGAQPEACVQGFCVDNVCCNTSACVSECDTANNRLITRQCGTSGSCTPTFTDCGPGSVCQNLACTPVAPDGGISHRPAAKARTSP